MEVVAMAGVVMAVVATVAERAAAVKEAVRVGVARAAVTGEVATVAGVKERQTQGAGS